MASKILAAALALMLALFPGLQAARAADMDISTAALSKMYLPQVQLALQDLEQNKIQEAMLQLGIKNESLSPVQIQELKARLKQFLAVYSRARVMYRGGPLPPSFVKKIRAAFSSKGDTDLNVDDFIGEGTQALRRDWAENSKTVLAPSANPYGRVVDQIKKDPAGNVVAYYHIVHLDQVHSLITISTPDKNARNGRSVEEIVFVADQGARQIQHTVYNRQFNGMLRQIVGMYKGDPDAKVPAEVGEYIHDITGIESEAGGAAAHAWSLKDADRYQQVSDIARSFYADSETGTLKKYFLSILTSYLSLATGVKPPKDDKVHQAVEVNAQSLAQLQSIMNSFPSGHLSGIEAALRWLHGASGVDTKISMDDLPPDIRGQSAQIMAEFGFASKDAALVLESGGGKADKQEREAALDARNGWLDLIKQRILYIELRLLDTALAQIETNDTQDKKGIKDDAKLVYQADALRKHIEGYLTELYASMEKSQKNLMAHTLAVFALNLYNAQFSDLYKDGLKDKILDMAANVEEMKALYLSEQYDLLYPAPKPGDFVPDNSAPLPKGAVSAPVAKTPESWETFNVGYAGADYAKFVKNPPPKVRKMTEQLDRLEAQLKGLSALAEEDPVKARLDLWPVRAEFMRIAAELGYPKIPELASVEEQMQTAAISQAAVQQSARMLQQQAQLFYGITYVYAEGHAKPEPQAWGSKAVFTAAAAADNATNWVANKIYHLMPGSDPNSHLVISHSFAPQVPAGDHSVWSYVKAMFPSFHSNGHSTTISGGLNPLMPMGTTTLAVVKGGSSAPHVTADSLMAAAVNNGGGKAGEWVFRHLMHMHTDFKWDAALAKKVQTEWPQIVDDMRNGDFSAAEKTLASWAPAAAKQGWDKYEKMAAPDKGDSNLDLAQQLSQPVVDKAGIEALSVMGDVQTQIAYQTLGSQLIDMPIDLAANIIATAGIGWAVSGIAGAVTDFVDAIRVTDQVLHDGILLEDSGKDIITAERVASILGDVPRADRIAKISNIMIKSRAIFRAAKVVSIPARFVARWGASVAKAMGAPVERGLRTGVKVRMALRGAVTANLRLVPSLGLFSGAFNFADYEINPHTSQSDSGWHAFESGFVGGTMMATKSQSLMFFAVPTLEDFGVKIGKAPLSSYYTDPGIANPIVRFGANFINPESALAKEGLWGGIQTLGESQVLKELASNSGHLGSLVDGTLRLAARAAARVGGMADSVAKFTLVNGIDMSVAQTAAYHWSLHESKTQKEQKKMAIEDTTTHLNAIRETVGFGRGAGQYTWMGAALLQQRVAGAAEDHADRVEKFKADNEVLRDPELRQRVLESPDDVALQVPIPFIDRSLKEKVKAAGEAVRGLVGGRKPTGQIRTVTVDGSIRGRVEEESISGGTGLDKAWRRVSGRSGEYAPADLIAASLVDYKAVKPGQIYDRSALKGIAGREAAEAGGKTPELPALEKMAPGSARLTDTYMETSRNELAKWLRSNPKETAKILAAGTEYSAPDGRGRAAPVRGDTLARLKELAASARIDSGAAPQTLPEKARGFWRRLMSVVRERPVPTGYQTLIADVAGRAGGDTPDEELNSIDTVVEGMIAERKGEKRLADAQALERLDGKIAGDAYFQYGGKRIAELRNEYKDAGRSEQEYLDAAGALAIDIVNRICGKGDFKDKDNTVITKLRPEQEQVILTWLKDYWNGDNMAFYRLLTGGGKTLSEASIARFLVPMARMEGRKGVIITTTSEELHRQLVADLLAYGGGRVPDGIKVMTMGELMGEQAQAQAQGRPGPFQDFYLMGDEMDEAGQRPPVSVGSQTGQFSLPGINPVLLRVQTAEREAETHYRAEYKGKNVGQQAWLKMKEENPALRADVEARSRRIWQEEIQPALQEAKTPAFKERFLDPGSDYYRNLGFHFANEADYVAEFGMTPAQAYQKMMKEYKDNFGADFYPKGSPSRLFAKAGAIERLFESPEKWVERIVDGAGILSSSTVKQLARMYTTTKEMDPNYRGPNRVITVYNGEPQSKMDNYELMAAQARAGTELTLPFKHEAVVNLKGFLMAAKNAGAKVYGLSGSLNEHLADGMKKMGMKIHGEASMYPEGKDIDLDVSADGQSLKDLTQVLAAPRTSETPHLAIVGTSDRLAADRLKKDLTEAGKRALIVSHPFSVHQTNNMFMNTGIDEARAAVAKGEADVVIFVDSYRGINLVYKAFAHGDIDAYVLNPDKLSTTDFIQLIGRWAKGRLPSDAEGNPNVTVRLHGIIDGEDVPESVENLAGTPGYDSALYQWLKEEAQREMERQAVMSSGFVSTKDLKEPAAKAPKAQKAAPAPAAPPSGAAVPGASSKRTLPVLKKNPNALPRGKPKRISRKEKDQANINAIKGENRAAEVLARNGYEVEQLEETKGAANNPDYRINGRIFDCYTPQSGNVRNAADYIAKKVGKGQADRIVLNLDNSKMRLDRLRKQLKTDPIKGLKEIIVIKGNKVIHFWP